MNIRRSSSCSDFFPGSVSGSGPAGSQSPDLPEGAGSSVPPCASSLGVRLEGDIYCLRPEQTPGWTTPFWQPPRAELQEGSSQSGQTKNPNRVTAAGGGPANCRRGPSGTFQGEHPVMFCFIKLNNVFSSSHKCQVLRKIQKCKSIDSTPLPLVNTLMSYWEGLWETENVLREDQLLHDKKKASRNSQVGCLVFTEAGRWKVIFRAEMICWPHGMRAFHGAALLASALVGELTDDHARRVSPGVDNNLMKAVSWRPWEAS